jgi:spermidine/putrescine transport system ATP-binding protein
MAEPYEVEVSDVTRRFGNVSAVDGVSLAVRPGEFLTLLGPSGCGKTTLLRIIAGFETPDEGNVVLGGRDVTSLPPYRRDVTTVFQHYALFPHMTVFRNVAFGLERKGVPRPEVLRRVADTLELVKLSGFENRMPGELSGGQQQRVALARAIVLEPRVLLLDEPLAALDLKLRKQMQVELKELQRRLGISFIYVTHDQGEALTMSDRVVVMNAGRIEQIGGANEIYERPQNEFVADFIGVSNVFPATVESVGETSAELSFEGGRVELSRGEMKAGEQVRIMIRPEKISLMLEGKGILKGRICSSVYLGESTQWRVRLESGKEILVLEQNRKAAPPSDDHVGRIVGLDWESESSVLLR